MQAFDQQLKHLLTAIKLSRDLQIEAVRDTIVKIQGFQDLVTTAEDMAQNALVDQTFDMSKAQIASMLPRLEAAKKVLRDCTRYTDHLSSELTLQVRFDKARPREIFRDETTLVTLTHHFVSGKIVSRGVTKGPFSLGSSIVNLILYMASPNGPDDYKGRWRWSQMMLLVAGKKMAGWSPVEKETGLVSAAELVPYAWVHRFLPQEATKTSRGDDARHKVMLPWLNRVAIPSLKFKWNRCSKHLTISGGARELFFLVHPVVGRVRSRSPR